MTLHFAAFSVAFKVDIQMHLKYLFKNKELKRQPTERKEIFVLGSFQLGFIIQKSC